MEQCEYLKKIISHILEMEYGIKMKRKKGREGGTGKNPKLGSHGKNKPPVTPAWRFILEWNCQSVGASKTSEVNHTSVPGPWVRALGPAKRWGKEGPSQLSWEYCFLQRHHCGTRRYFERSEFPEKEFPLWRHGLRTWHSVSKEYEFDPWPCSVG